MKKIHVLLKIEGVIPSIKKLSLDFNDKGLFYQL